MRIRRTIIFSAIFSVISLSGTSISNASFPAQEVYTKISPDELTDILNIQGRTINYGPFMISRRDTINGPLIIVAGSLDIQSGGVLRGDAWVINGKLVLTGGAKITGKAELINSSDYKSRQAKIMKGIRYYKCECRLDHKQFEDNGKLVFIKKEDPRALKTKFSLKPGYPCRVDYNILRTGLTRYNPKHKDPYTSWHARLHIPIWKKTGGFFGFDAELKVPIVSGRFDFVARAFKKTDTNDKWQSSRLENGTAIILSGDDFADYYEKRGGEAGLVIKAGKTLVIESFLSFESDISLSAGSMPSLFRGDRKWRKNPDIDEGERFAARINLIFDTRDETGWKYNGWRLGLLFEKGIADGPGKFSYSAFNLDVARYTELPAGLKFDLGCKLFSSFDKLPRQLTHSVSGYTGIRGLRDDPFTVHRGDRLALLSGELRSGLPELPLLRILFTRADLLLFSDIGILVDSENKKAPLGFLSSPFNKWKKTVGIGVSGNSFLPYLGIYLAEDLDSNDFSPRVIIRAQRSF